MTQRHEILNAARAALSNGRPELAERTLRMFLIDNPQDVDALYYSARSLAALGQFNEAVGIFSRLLAIRPDHARAAIQLGVAYSSMGNHQAALRVLDGAKTFAPHAAELDFALGLCQLGLDDLPAAAASFRQAITRNMRIPDVYNNLGATLVRLGQLPEAVESFRQAIALAPDFVIAKRNLGDALVRIGDASGAIDAYRDAAALQSTDPGVHVDLGAALFAANEFLAAAASFERALSLDHQLVDVAALLGDAYRLADQPERAADAYAQALARQPKHAEALLGLGLVSAARHDPASAAQFLVAAWEQKPVDARIVRTVANALDGVGLRSQALDIYERAAGSLSMNADIHEAHGTLLHRLGRLKEALACYERGLSIDPSRRSMRLNRGHALESLGSIAEALACFRGVLEAEPDDRSALAGAASSAFRICDWNLAEETVQKLLQTADGIDALHPFLRLALPIEPAVLAESYRRESHAIAMCTPEQAMPAFSHDRIRVAYISPDFRQHPAAYALAGIIRGHDRGLIEPIGVSLTAPDDSEIAHDLRSSFEAFMDCSAMTDPDIVRLLRAREIDIAVDLAGFTSGARPSIFAARVAPVQLNYLGFPCSTGARFMDSMIADRIVIPANDEHLYTERIERLPHTYLPFDRDRVIGAQPASRAAVGLPDAGLVFCAFTNGYKVSRDVFKIWMTLLVEVPDSVLWLRGGHPAMELNLTAAARDSGVGADRLVFSTFVERMDEHFARLQLADLFLDTLPYNAHTTTAEALWAGVPVITCCGRTFAGRVGASLLSAAGLPELITDSLDTYRDRALHLARSPEALAELRQRLADARAAAAVFDTAGYVRDFETVLRNLWLHS